jgi:hypothetical protein
LQQNADFRFAANPESTIAQLDRIRLVWEAQLQHEEF